MISSSPSKDISSQTGGEYVLMNEISINNHKFLLDKQTNNVYTNKLKHIGYINQHNKFIGL